MKQSYFLKLVGFYWLFSMSFVFAQIKSYEIPENIEVVNISKYFVYYEDASKLMSLKEISKMEAEKWKPITKDDPNLGFKKINLWLALQLHNNSNKTETYYLELDYPLLDKVDIFTQNGESSWQKIINTVGDAVPFSTRPFFYRNLVFPLKLEPFETRSFLIKIDSDSSLQFPAYLYSQARLIKHIAITEILFGFFYGILLIMGIYNLVLFFAIRNNSYLYYVIYIVFYGTVQAALNGHAFQYLWSNATWWGNTVVPMGLCAGGAGAILFMISFLSTEKYLPRFNKVLWGLVALLGVFSLLGLVLPYSISVRIGTVAMLIVGIVELSTGIVVWRIGNKSAIYFILSWAFFLIGIMTVALIAAGIVPNHPFLRVSHLIGAMFQVVGLSFALADRVNTIRKERALAQAEALKALEENARIIKEQNEMLERKVAERTHELKQKQEEILAQNEELQQQREEITAQRDFIEVKNKELTELNTHMSQSIQYASHIQKAILPDETIIRNYVDDFFLIYFPKDVVSGDFYWFSKIENHLFFAAVDCTGHGVPGAFMSMIGNTLLNKIINENKIFDPAQVLSALNEGVITSLRQRETGNNDGMDVCLCRIDIKNEEEFELYFAGARRPLYIFKDDTIIELKGSRSHIGGSGLGIMQTPYETYQYSLQKGDVIYLSTDGYTDNPNPDRQKFGTDKLKTLLLLYGKEPMDRQCYFLKEELLMFQKNAPQRDDILVMGIRL
jgi:serine phosphatase RsbU (regulator of sigma subunit)